jgi:SNF2 family DNA or RNA helicase
VLRELPDKIETVESVDLTVEQKQLYVGYLDKLRKQTEADLDQEGFRKNRLKILAGLTRLRQICCHPRVFAENYHGGSGKLELLLEIMDQALGSNKKMLVFSQFTSMLAIIRESLEERGWPYFYLDGETPTKQRLDLAESFNQGTRPIFLISLKAGGTGLNLTGADTVILYDLWWNPAVEDQAADRAHRIGQKNVVQVIRLITEGTIEEKMYQLQEKKRDLIDQVVQANNADLGSLSEQDVRELLAL